MDNSVVCEIKRLLNDSYATLPTLQGLDFTDIVLGMETSTQICVGVTFNILSNDSILGKGFYQLTQSKVLKSGEFHCPVFVDEVVNSLVINPDGIYLDATVGGGGHSKAILQRLSPKGRVIGIDLDDEALEYAKQELREFQNQVILRKGNFKFLREILEAEGIDSVDGVLFDLGVSSHQLDTDYRGFSYLRDGPLDMRMNREQKKGAFHVVNSYSFSELKRIFLQYGEERHAAKIARAIIHARTRQQIDSTLKLAEVIRSCIPASYVNKTLSRIFQAIRIEVNEELTNLRLALEEAVEVLKPAGRLVVISYHSLEDRIVKIFFRENSKIPTSLTGLPIDEYDSKSNQQRIRLKLITKKPITPSDEQKRYNIRIRSAKMRICERL